MSEYIVNLDGELGMALGVACAAAGFAREKITRCRDCRFAAELVNGMYDCQGELTESWDYYNDEPKQNQVPPDGFCCWGEPREGGE